MRDLKLKHLAVIFSFLLLACQDSDLETDQPIDSDMEDALALADEFLSASRNNATDKDITVIKYQKDLLFKTNTIAGSYDPIDEMTVTAESKPGGFVFWHAGGGVKRLIGIEMDDYSQDLLDGNVPFEVVPGHYWALWIPNDIEKDDEDDEEDEDDENENEDIYLKYDIVYETNSGEIVRLDPKLQVKNQE